jgi:TfoX/Sxy family transcriptional regulator of competence genes
MAYDEELADRIRELLVGEPAVIEQKMFGGLAFLVGGHMAVAASGQGGLLVRVDPARSDEIVASGKAQPMVMRGREMTGWLRVDAGEVRTREELATWVSLGRDYARSLPPKASGRPPPGAVDAAVSQGRDALSSAGSFESTELMRDEKAGRDPDRRHR